nr:MAG TPA: hypothetical protein [Caudoviricetes sp.]
MFFNFYLLSQTSLIFYIFKQNYNNTLSTKK